MIFLALVFMLAVSNSLGQIPVSSCPEVQVVQNFNASGYLGKWYEQEKYPIIWELGGRCITATYSLNSNGTVKVFNQQIVNNQESNITGNARIDSDKGEAKLLVKFYNPEVTAPYWVIGTDYDNYSVVFSCDKVFGITGAIHSWVKPDTVWLGKTGRKFYVTSQHILQFRGPKMDATTSRLPITISQIGKLFGNAFMKAASVKTAVSGFRKTGVHPLQIGPLKVKEMMTSYLNLEKLYGSLQEVKIPPRK